MLSLNLITLSPKFSEQNLLAFKLIYDMLFINKPLLNLNIYSIILTLIQMTCLSPCLIERSSPLLTRQEFYLMIRREQSCESKLIRFIQSSFQNFCEDLYLSSYSY